VEANRLERGKKLTESAGQLTGEQLAVLEREASERPEDSGFFLPQDHLKPYAGIEVNPRGTDVDCVMMLLMCQIAQAETQGDSAVCRTNDFVG
jgi:hypothetical protein